MFMYTFFNHLINVNHYTYLTVKQLSSFDKFLSDEDENIPVDVYNMTKMITPISSKVDPNIEVLDYSTTDKSMYIKYISKKNNTHMFIMYFII